MGFLSPPTESLVISTAILAGVLGFWKSRRIDMMEWRWCKEMCNGEKNIELSQELPLKVMPPIYWTPMMWQAFYILCLFGFSPPSCMLIISILERRTLRLRGTKRVAKDHPGRNAARILHSDFGPNNPYHTNLAKAITCSFISTDWTWGFCLAWCQAMAIQNG